MSYNRVFLLGNLGADPEMRTAGNSVVTSVRLATNEVYVDKSGSKQTITEWHDLEFWGKQAELAKNYLRKGSSIFVEGRIKSDTWEDKEGNKRKTIRIRVLNFNFLDKSENSPSADPSSSVSSGYSHPPTSAESDDDLPF